MSSKIHTDPTVFVIFGGTGDLNMRKLAPAIYNLFLDGWLPGNFAVVGTGRTKFTDEEYRAKLLEGINSFSRSGKADKAKWDEFQKHVFYQVSDATDSATYKEFSHRIDAFNAEWKTKANVIYYLAVSPNFFPIIASNLAKAGLTKDTKRTRIVIEKPFGHDLDSAKELNALLANIFDECQIYRIDHYLGKETVQNIMAFRFANSLFEPIWNRNFIEHVQISVTESLGVEDRGDYYDGSGAMRDMIQNHLLQLLCLVAMETPINFDASEVRDRKVEVLRAMRKFSPEDVRNSAVRGQYGQGWMTGKEVPGYREEAKVDAESNTETFAAIKFFVDNWRWQGVPFYVRTGKRMHQSASVITIQFKDVPHKIFPAESTESWQQNRLIISIQPEMSIRLQVQAKRPGIDMILNAVDMVFDYKGTYTNQAPEAYETLLLDAMLGDQTLFMRGDQVETAWELVMPILHAWQNKKSLSFPNYSADSWGPEAAEALIARDGYHWFTLPLKDKK
ncbi:glucose-6-phosphate dehydrogenase [Mucilaginibacter myungsuensis]|uniref:Glucose-6-phosphate 1-dehydrogenase n=1 Tax=Mucilaginibacter myungsuensis TaxID=649104 RepID=A0A929KUP9_9SPHI|nr:glucose-6-phosphate dehydrogenase [Mucilaginibacter myungsuensis]MBE9661916.1 glucose-6-phosphate dehydrogenase [Mucilaginibacter myungsuensis]MDN3599650.1 glucose-6-phosphate dehydrogenase [Mucilaginibacter myungsuensis]